jgi:hypothetical protein
MDPFTDALIQQIERRGRTMNPPMDAAVISKLREDLGLRELSG